jgi:hypothetical protein
MCVERDTGTLSTGMMQLKARKRSKCSKAGKASTENGPSDRRASRGSALGPVALRPLLI